jgi:hypothetical protein
MSTGRFIKSLKLLFASLASVFLFSLVTAFVAMLTIVAIPNVIPAIADESQIKDAESRSIGEMRRDVEAFLKNSKSSDDMDLQVGGIIDLCYMHQEIVSDPRFASNRQLQSIRAVAADRLKKYLKTIEIEKARKSRRIRKAQSEENNKMLGGESVPGISAESAERPPMVPGSSESGAEPGSPSDGEMSDSGAMDELLYSSMSSMGNLTGGPSQMFGYLSGHFAPPWDHGEELVNLIESTINPEFWQSNGGSGIIYYYRPSRIIVVGATSQIQDDLTNMLRNLRRLSR